MKLMIASDIHGSAYYASLLLERFGKEAPDRLLLLGDILYHGPRNDLPRDYAPKKVIELLNPLAPSLMCVRGNCDTEVDQMVLKFPILADYALVCDGNRLFTATHGHHLDEVAASLGSGIILYGHTHIPDNTLRDGIRYINPGSVSIPKNGTRHSFLLYSGGVFDFRDVETGESYDSFCID